MLSSFLLIGQSNMSGRGVLTAENRIFDGRILRLVNGRWQTMWEPLSADRVFAGASLAPAFALEYIKLTGEPGRFDSRLPTAARRSTNGSRAKRYMTMP